MQGTIKDEEVKGEERKKREIQENITKTRITQKIDNSNPYQSIQPILPGQQAYPVQFEPLAHIRLSRSTYKVTTFIEFKPYIASFLRFQRFLELFLADLVDPSRVSIYKHILGGHMTPQERTLITRVITRDKCSQTQDEVCSEETVKVDGRQILSQAECKKRSKYTILTTHLYTCVIIIDITFFYIYFNEKHCILIYYCLLIFSFHFFIITNVI